MSDIGIGKKIASPQNRDAIHVAVVPVICGDLELAAGEHIGLRNAGVLTVSSVSENKIGIVDPFLRENVQQGEEFWMFLYPGTITSLRHDWTHTTLDAQRVIAADAHMLSLADPEGEHKRALEREAEAAGLSYKELIAAAHQHVETGEFLNQGGRWEGHSVDDEFWKHYEAVTGEDSKGAGNFFSCSC